LEQIDAPLPPDSEDPRLIFQGTKCSKSTKLCSGYTNITSQQTDGQMINHK